MPSTRPTQNKSSKTAAPNTGKEGMVFLTSSGTPYTAPKITATKLRQYSKNFYGAGISKKLTALFFGDKLEIKITDPGGEQDEDLSKEVYNMVTGPDVNLFSKMKIGYMDRFWLGEAFFNPVWEQNGATWTLINLRRLPPESFSPAAQNVNIVTAGPNAAVAGTILKGVVAMPESAGGQIRYFQTGADGNQTELKYVYTVKDSTSPEVAGEPDILPVVPVLTMLDFAHSANMQRVNRVGSPILLLKIVNAKADDVKYGEKLIKNWGKDTGFILRPNMEIVEFDPKDSDAAVQTIEKLTEMIIDYWVPTNLLSKNGQLIGGNSNSDLGLLYSFIAGVHREIEAEWEPLLQIYLDANGYEGYRVKIKIPDPEIDDSTVKLEQAKVGADTGLLTDNEVRARLGAEEMTEEELANLPARKKEAKAEEAARQKAEALKLQAQQPPGMQQPGQPGQQPGGQAPGQGGPQSAPGRGDQAPGNTPGTPQKKAPKIASKNTPQQFKQSRPYFWPDEPNQGDPSHGHEGDKDPDPTLSRIMESEEKELDLALEALSRAVLAKL